VNVLAWHEATRGWTASSWEQYRRVSDKKGASNGMGGVTAASERECHQRRVHLQASQRTRRAPRGGCGGTALHQFHRWQICRRLGARYGPSLESAASSEAGLSRSRVKWRLGRYRCSVLLALPCCPGCPRSQAPLFVARRLLNSVRLCIFRT